MKTKSELEQGIIDITMKIHRKYPELVKYISEMPENFSANENSEIATKSFKEYYNSLEEVVLEYEKTHVPKRRDASSKTSELEGYPLYPPSEDIYQKGKEERELDPEAPSKQKTKNPKAGVRNEKDFQDDMSGDDLDVPGSELDDQQESVGSEDEENNYYSIGGDNHNDLEEDES